MKLKLKNIKFLCGIALLMTLIFSGTPLFAQQPKPTPQEYLASEDFKIALQTAQKHTAYFMWDSLTQSQKTLSAEDLSFLTRQTATHFVFEDIQKKYQEMGAPVRYITLVDGSLVEQAFPDPQKAAIVNAANGQLESQQYGIDSIIRGQMGAELSKFEKQCSILKMKKYLIQQFSLPQDPYHADDKADNNLQKYIPREADYIPGEANYIPGEAGLTDACGDLKKMAAYVINAVGPDLRVYDNIQKKYVHRKLLGTDAINLSNVYRECLNRTQETGTETIAFCPISTVNCGYDINQAAPIAIKTVIEWLGTHPTSMLKEVRFVTYSQKPPENQAYQQAFLSILQEKKLPIQPSAKINPEFIKTLNASTTKPKVLSPQGQKISGGQPPLIFSVNIEKKASDKDTLKPQPPAALPSAAIKPQPPFITLVDNSLIEQTFPEKDKAVIVNAANSELLGGGGIDGRIWDAVGKDSKKFAQECHILRKKKYLINQGQLPQSPYRGDVDQIEAVNEASYDDGEAGITHAFGDLATRVGYVIHAVGPDLTESFDAYKEGFRPPNKNDQHALENAYKNSLDRANEAHLKIIAFCPISTNIFKYDINLATPKAIETVIAWLNTHKQSTIEEVRFVTYSGMPHEYATYRATLNSKEYPLKDITGNDYHDIVSGRKLAQRTPIRQPAPPGKTPLVFQVLFPSARDQYVTAMAHNARFSCTILWNNNG